MKIRAKQYTTHRLEPTAVQRPHCPAAGCSAALPASGEAMTPVGEFSQLQPTIAQHRERESDWDVVMFCYI